MRGICKEYLTANYLCLGCTIGMIGMIVIIVMIGMIGMMYETISLRLNLIHGIEKLQHLPNGEGWGWRRI